MNVLLTLTLLYPKFLYPSLTTLVCMSAFLKQEFKLNREKLNNATILMIPKINVK